MARFALSLGMLILGAPSPAQEPAAERALNAAKRALRDGFVDHAAQLLQRFPEQLQESEVFDTAILLLARVYLENDDPQKAIDLLKEWDDRILDRQPGALFWTAEARFAQAEKPRGLPSVNRALERQSLRNAADQYQTLLTEFPNAPFRAHAILSRCIALVRLGESAQALTELDRATSDLSLTEDWVPLKERLRLLRAELQIETGQFEDALSAIDELQNQRLDPKRLWEIEFLRARIHSERKDYESVLRQRRKLSQAAIMTGSVEAIDRARFLIADAFFQLGKFNRAVNTLLPIAENATRSQRFELALQRLVEMSLESKRYQPALNYLRKFKSVNPDPIAQLRAELTTAELELLLAPETALDSALARFERIANNSDPELRGLAETARYRLGLARRQKGDFDTSLQDFALISEAADDIEIRIHATLRSAEIYNEKGAYQDALRMYQQAWNVVQDKPLRNTEIQTYIAHNKTKAHLNLDARDDAIDFYRSLGADSQTVGIAGDLILIIAQYDIERNAIHDAQTLLSEWIERGSSHPTAERARLALAETYQKSRDWRVAIEIYQSWLQRNGDDPDVECDLAMAKFRADKSNLGALVKFVSKHPKHQFSAYFMLITGLHRYQQGDYEIAFTTLNTLAKSPNFRDSDHIYRALLWAGRAARENGDLATAEGCFQRLCDLPVSALPERLQSQSVFTEAFFELYDLLAMTPTSRENLDALFARKIDIMNRLLTKFPGSRHEPKALAALGKAYLDRAGLSEQPSGWLTQSATNFSKILERAENAEIDQDIYAQATMGLARTFEARAEIESEPNRRLSLLNSALDLYLRFFWDDQPNSGAPENPYWFIETGRAAAYLIETHQLEDLERAQAIRDELRKFDPLSLTYAQPSDTDALNATN